MTGAGSASTTAPGERCATPRLLRPRDRAILRWIARQPIANAAQVGVRFAARPGGVLDALRVLVGHGYLSRERILRGDPSVYRATARGLRVAGLTISRRGCVSLRSYDHDLALASLCIELELEFGPECVLTKVELREREYRVPEGRFCVNLHDPNRRHYPDLAVEDWDGERALFVELEDRPRRKRLDPILWAYAGARHVAGVRVYTCAPAVERSMARVLERVGTPAGLIELRRLHPPRDSAASGAQDRSTARPRGMGYSGSPGAATSSRERLGGPRLSTRRDREIVRWVGRQQIVTAAHVCARFGISAAVGYRCLRRLVVMALLAHERVAHDEPGVYRATRRGLTLAELTLRPAKIDLLRYRHSLDLAALCVELEREFGAERVVTERELRRSDDGVPEPRYAAIVGAGPYGALKRHFPDLAIERYASARPLAVELERTLKERRRLDPIVSAYVGARHIAAVRYYVLTPEIERGLRAAFRRVGAPDELFDIRPWPSRAAVSAVEPGVR